MSEFDLRKFIEFALENAKVKFPEDKKKEVGIYILIRKDIECDKCESKAKYFLYDLITNHFYYFCYNCHQKYTMNKTQYVSDFISKIER